MSAAEESLVGQIADQVRELPQDLRVQVLDFDLHARYLSDRDAERDSALAETLSSWQDEREAEEIARDIYAQRTILPLEFEL